MTANELFKGFEPVSPKAWKQKIQVDLKGGDYNELLTHLSPEGILIKPFYTAEDRKGDSSELSHAGQSWKIGYAVDAAGDSAAEQAADALANGVEQLLIRLRSGGETPSDSTWDKLGNTGPMYWEREDLKAHWEEGIPASCRMQSTVLADPIGTLAASGNWSLGMEEDLDWVFEAAAGSEESETKFALMIRADVYQGAGANRVQELAYTLAHAHEYLLRAKNAPGGYSIMDSPVFKVSLGGDYFMDIAKLRVLRRLWALLAQDHGLTGNCKIIALPGLRNKTLYDYNTNMLRTTLECMSAVLGGADLICNQPYDALYNPPNSFGDRIARNQLLLLRHESHFDKVGNPADGSYYLESLTDQLGSQALELFKMLEKGGGLLAQLKSHQIQKKIRESAEKAAQALNDGDSVLVGSTVFPNPEDRMSDKVPEGYPGKSKGGKALIEPLPLRRLTVAYESQRLQDETR